MAMATTSIAVEGQDERQSNEAEEKERGNVDETDEEGNDNNGADQMLDAEETKLDQDETNEAGKRGQRRRRARGKGASALSKRRKAAEDKKARAGEGSDDHDEDEVAEEADKSQADNGGAEEEKQHGKRVTAATEHEEKDSSEEKEGQQEEAEEKVETAEVAINEDEPRARRDKRKAPATTTQSPNKRVGRKDRQDERPPMPLDAHDMVSAGETRPLHPRVLDFVQWEDDAALLRRAHTRGDGSCMLNAFLMGVANGVHPTAEAVQALRLRLKTEIEEMTKEAWDSLGDEHDGQCSTPQEYTQRFLSQSDTFLDRSILHFCLQLKREEPPAHPLPCLIYCITVQPLFPDAPVEHSDDISVRMLNKADMVIRVHRFGQRPTLLSAPTDCIVLYQLWGATVSKHMELVVHSDPPLTRFPHDHPFIVALDKHVSTRTDQIDVARNSSFVCAPLQGWTFPCLLDVDFLSPSSSSVHDSPPYSGLPVVQRILTTVRRDLDRSDRRFLRYLVALSHISQMRNADKREEEYNKVVHFLDEYEPCNMPIILGCIAISFFIYATPHVGKWFHAQKRVTLKMLASCPAALVRDEYLLRLLFLHLVHNKALMKRDDITTLATQLIAEYDISIKGGWDIDNETYEFTFLVIHTAGEAEEDERVLKHERAWWIQSKLMEDKHWRKLVEARIKTVRSLTIKELGSKVRRGKNGGQDQLCTLISGDPQHPRWWTRDQILHHKVKQWKEKLDEFEAQEEKQVEDDEKVQPAVDNKDTLIRKLRAEIAKEKAACEKERMRRETAEQALKERVEKDREQIKKAKEALAAERNEIAQRKLQLDKQEAKIQEWLKAHPDAGTVVDV
jgi:hypothetical protein